MPNITGTVGVLVNTSGGQATEAFSASYDQHDLEAGISADKEKAGNTTFDASRVSAVYGDIDTVQPPAIALFPQIRF